MHLTYLCCLLVHKFSCESSSCLLCRSSLFISDWFVLISAYARPLTATVNDLLNEIACLMTCVFAVFFSFLHLGPHPSFVSIIWAQHERTPFATLWHLKSFRVAYVVTNLTGRARERPTAMWERNYVRYFFSCVISGFWSVSCHEEERALGSLRQGRNHVFDYTIQFHTLVAGSRWNDEVTCSPFLSFYIGDCLTKVGLPTGFEVLVELAIKVDNWLHDCEWLSATIQREVMSEGT